MAHLTAYFDESGSYPEHPVVVVSGLVASTKQWSDFSRKWNKLLRSQGVSVFHMSECENFQGEFKLWTPERKRLFIIDLIKLTKEFTRTFMGAIVLCKDFDSVVPKFPNISRTPYQLCADRCIHHLSIWMEKSPQRKDLTVIFDKGNTRAPEMIELFCENSKPKWKCDSADKREEIPLQAADLIAYEVFKYKKNEIDGRPRPVRKSILTLLKDEKQQWLTETKETMEQYFADLMKLKEYQDADDQKKKEMLRNVFAKP